LNVFIDGTDILDAKKTEESLSKIPSDDTKALTPPLKRAIIAADVKEKLCSEAENSGAKITITGIQRSYLDASIATSSNLTMVVENSKIICFGSEEQCASASAESTTINLKKGHALPGLTAVSVSLGLSEISGESGTADGVVRNKGSLSPNDTVYAKYGVHLDGRAFARARIGGVTKAITAPLYQGFVDGVSVGIRTSGKKTILNGGIFQDDVALHFTVGQQSKGKMFWYTVISINRTNCIRGFPPNHLVCNRETTSNLD
jgi:hypothetical protein